MTQVQSLWQKGTPNVCCSGIEVQIKSCAVTNWKYAKLILILVKQLVDLNFDKSYMTKSNQKPLYKTRFMLDNGCPAYPVRGAYLYTS